MSKIITLEEARQLPPGQLKDWAYNALDNTGTREVADVLLPRLSQLNEHTYAFERGLQAPALSMMFRGVRVDEVKRNQMVVELKREMSKDMRAISKLPEVTEKWDGHVKDTGFCPMNFGKKHKWPRGVEDTDPNKKCEKCGTPRMTVQPFNPGSPSQTAHLFYDLNGVKPMMNKSHKVSTDEDVLQRIGIKHPKLLPITERILAVRDKAKQLGSLAAKLTPDGRYPSSFNVGAAWTGRFSSSKNPFQLGGNLQNVAERHRRVFIADYNMLMGYADYMQGESNIVAHMSGDEKYIEAHRLGDVHTYVTRYIWPELPWTGDLAKDKKIAKVNPPWDLAPGHDYRFQCKRIQHGSNYGMTPPGISMVAHIPILEARRAYERYMTEFDGIPAWQGWVANEIKEHRPLCNPMGRCVHLFGRPWDPHTVKQGLAFLPSSTLADIEDVAMWQVWWELEQEGLWLLAQVHDALLHEFPHDRLDLEKRLLELMAIPVPITDIRGNTRVMTIGVETAIGRNWGHKSEDNPYGIDEPHWN